ncbi:MAG: low specificity L-threonine aldolase [Ruminococcaceae bacterium]|jgi:threonine aldolase|nr:low specificity L-threonine aldolase [Oscillospiraceae bacterium]
MKYIDFRSDTVTLPTDEMRAAMAAAECGDDVYEDDPTTNRLEELAAQMLGKEKAMFTSSGTMGNQLGIMGQTRKGDEIIVSADAHIFTSEAGATALLSGANMCTLHFENTIPNAQQIEAAIRSENVHHPDTTLICLENALANGMVVPVETMAEIYAVAQKHGIKVHLDGARVFNAATALGVPVTELTKYCDTVTACLSKGLCAPVGAVLAGSAEFIKAARRYRKILGGGMRQTGVLAAAGIISLEKMTKRLQEDHDNAKYLAKKLNEVPYLHVNEDAVQVNIVFCDIDKPAEQVKAMAGKLREKGIKIGGYDNGKTRFVTNNDITREHIDLLVKEIQNCF